MGFRYCSGWDNATANGRTRVLSTGRPTFCGNDGKWIVAAKCPFCLSKLIVDPKSAAWRLTPMGDVHIRITQSYK